MYAQMALAARLGSAGRLAALSLVLLLLAPPMAHSQSLGLDRAAKEATTKRLLKQLADLNLWAGVVACSDSAEGPIYKVGAAGAVRWRQEAGGCTGAFLC